jgi:ATP/maltotriose-dependent transcriptional regulator MalT
LLGARLDRLGPAERTVVESASVIGLEFSSDAVSALLEEIDGRTDLEPALAALCRKQLIRRAEAGAADDFHFSHILVRDAAYARLLKRTRARLHERFAAWLADMVGSRVAERNYISTTAGLLADVLYREGRYDESAEFARVCERLASPDDVASQFHWRCVRGKLRAQEGAIDEAKSLLSAATALIETSDQLDLQGYGLLDFAEVCELAGAPADASDLVARRHTLPGLTGYGRSTTNPS